MRLYKSLCPIRKWLNSSSSLVLSTPDIQQKASMPHTELNCSFLVVVFVVNGFTPQTRLASSTSLVCAAVGCSTVVQIIDSQEIVSDSPQHEFSLFFLAAIDKKSIQ